MITLIDLDVPLQATAGWSVETLKAYRNEYHEPVLLSPTVEALAPAAGRVIVDGTLGDGGHASALLAAGARVIGFDQDPEAIRHATRRLGAFREQFTAVRTSFARAAEALDSLGVELIDGALLDLGVSSQQLAAPERGFSFLRDGPLDMRMDPQTSITASDLVNMLSGEALEDLFRRFGEEPAARKIAARLVRERMLKKFTSTLQLAQTVERVVPRRGKTHPATRVFQALRLVVNRELEVLEEGLEQFSSRLARGGRLAVITFHSLEDRMVKTFFAHHSAPLLDRPEWPEPRPNPKLIFKKITRKAVVANAVEERANPRSRSARLRVVEKL